MAVKAVIFDVSGTLLVEQGSGRHRLITSVAQPGVEQALARLKSLGVKLLAATNDPLLSSSAALEKAGLWPSLIDAIVTPDQTGKKKGSPLWTKAFQTETGFAPNEMLYVGDSDFDVFTAAHGRILYAHAGWSTSPGKYGLVAPRPGWVPAVVQHIFRKEHPWYWTLDDQDARGRPVSVRALVNASGAGDYGLQQALLQLLKNEVDPAPVGQLPFRDFVMLHLLSSLSSTGLIGSVDCWTTYPGHAGKQNLVMGTFLSVAAKLYRDRYLEDVFNRWKVAKKSAEAFSEGGLTGAIANQLGTVRLDPTYRGKLDGKHALVVDNFFTRGPTMELARNFLMAGGATAVTVAVVGKYGYASADVMNVVTGPATGWDPFDTLAPGPSQFKVQEKRGQISQEALAEFRTSYQRMKIESW